MFVYVLTGRASKPVLCSIYTKSTEQLNYFQKTGLRALNIVCGQRSTVHPRYKGRVETSTLDPLITGDPLIEVTLLA
jgi:hypothetical protein